MRRLLFAVLLLSACFNPDEPPCSFACGDNNACPDDYTCNLTDGYCHKNGDTSQCGYSDAAMALDFATADLTMSLDMSEGDGGTLPDLLSTD